jgi:hypothetical protein
MDARAPSLLPLDPPPAYCIHLVDEVVVVGPIEDELYTN